ncbi:MAG: hypothetical protein HQK78_13180, partial [Desulfobacterales bacterium]|nr:hypothetical protein [Desulfobacterales bacterium]
FRDSKDRDDFLSKVREHLMKEFSSETVEKIMKIYTLYLDCELELQQAMLAWEQPKNEQGWINLSNKIYEFRKTKLGNDLGEGLFGYQHKTVLFDIMTDKIHKDKSLYGSEKEKKIQMIAAKIFGDAADSFLSDKNDETAYQQKLQLYKKDMDEMTEDEKRKKLRAIREEFFSTEDVKEMELAEEKIEKEKNRDQSYDLKKNEILKDQNLSKTEKEEKIKRIQDEIYGEMASEIRRGEEFSQKHNELMKQTIEQKKQRIPDKEN